MGITDDAYGEAIALANARKAIAHAKTDVNNVKIGDVLRAPNHVSLLVESFNEDKTRVFATEIFIITVNSNYFDPPIPLIPKSKVFKKDELENMGYKIAFNMSAPVLPEPSVSQPKIKEKESNSINHPRHYNNSDARCPVCDHQIECIDVVRRMDFNLGNVIKYIWRSPHKGKRLEDLKKALWYLEDEIKKLESE